MIDQIGLEPIIEDEARKINYVPAEDSPYAVFHDTVFDMIDPDPYILALHTPGGRGQPPIDYRVKLGAVILARMDGQTLEYFAEHLKTDLAYRYALHLNYSDSRIPSYSCLRGFVREVRNYLDETGIDLIHNTFVDMTEQFVRLQGTDLSKLREDSCLVDINARRLSRFQLIYVCTRNYVVLLNGEKLEIPDRLKHFLDKGDFNAVTYHDTTTSEDDKMKTLLEDAAAALGCFASTHEETREFTTLRRCLDEQTFIVQKGECSLRPAGDPALRGIREVPGEGGDPTIVKQGILQTPVDTDATYNGKRGEHHVGYVVTATEAGGAKGPLITDYTVHKNNVGDSRMGLELAERMPAAEGPDGGVVIADAGFSGEALKAMLATRNYSLVNTNVTGLRTPDCFADIQFGGENGLTVIACPAGHTPSRVNVHLEKGTCDVWMDKPAGDGDGKCCCQGCPYFKECHPQEQKTAFKRTFSVKQKTRAASVRERSTEQFKLYSHFRNGIEPLFSYLRRLGLDGIPVFGQTAVTIDIGLTFLAGNVRRFCRRSAA